MARRERSAGFILFHRDNDGPRRYLLLDYGRHWDYPKGHVEAGEDDLAAARRELREETGIDRIEIVEGFSREIVYRFRSGKRGMIEKTVVFFVAQTHQTDVKISDEHVGFEFVEYERAIKQVTYETARSVLRDAESFLNGR